MIDGNIFIMLKYIEISLESENESILSSINSRYIHFVFLILSISLIEHYRNKLFFNHTKQLHKIKNSHVSLFQCGTFKNRIPKNTNIFIFDKFIK